MNEDRLLQFVLSRMETRTSVSNATTTVASSASLVLIALFFSLEMKDEFAPFMIILGIIFPLLAIVFIEISYKTIHRRDHDIVRRLVGKELETDVLITKWRNLRYALNRFFLVFPIFGWFFILDNILNLGYVLGIGLSLVAIGMIIGLTLDDRTYINRLRNDS